MEFARCAEIRNKAYEDYQIPKCTKCWRIALEGKTEIEVEKDNKEDTKAFFKGYSPHFYFKTENANKEI